MAPTAKTKLIPVGSFEPDRGKAKAHQGENFLVVCYNLIPHSSGWLLVFAPQDLALWTNPGGDPNPEYPQRVVQGAFCHVQGKFLYKIHAARSDGTMTIIDPRTPDAGKGTVWEPTDVTPAVPIVPANHVGVHYTAFGDLVIASTGENSPVQKYVEGTDTEFSDLIAEGAAEDSSYYYNARFCGVTDNKVLLAYLWGGANADDQGAYELFKTRVAWSGVNLPDQFHDQLYQENATQSGWAELPDNHGPITGLSAGADYSLVFKARTIYRMSNVGNLYIYDFQPIPQEVGTVWPHSIARVGNDVYFWGSSGPCVYRGSEHRVDEIGLGRVSRWLTDFEMLNQTAADPGYRGSFRPDERVALLSAAVDSYSGVVVWTLPMNFGNPGRTNWALVYNYQRNEFSMFNQTENSTTKYYLSHALGTVDTGDHFRPLRDVLFFAESGGVQDDKMIGYKRDRANPGVYSDGGATTKPAFYLGAFTEFFPETRVKINGVRLVFASRSGAEIADMKYEVFVYSADTHHAPAADITKGVYRSDTNADRRGYVRTPDCPYRVLHAIGIQFGDPDLLGQTTGMGDFSDIEGIYVELQKGGEK